MSCRMRWSLIIERLFATHFATISDDTRSFVASYFLLFAFCFLLLFHSRCFTYQAFVYSVNSIYHRQ